MQVAAAMGNRNEAYYACPAVAGGSSAAPADAVDNVADNDDAAPEQTMMMFMMMMPLAMPLCAGLAFSLRLPRGCLHPLRVARAASSFFDSCLLPPFPSSLIPFGLASWHLKTFYARRALG